MDPKWESKSGKSGASVYTSIRSSNMISKLIPYISSPSTSKSSLHWQDNDKKMYKDIDILHAFIIFLWI